jgi:predicted GIY-YIG superfamily endonuclease
MIKTPYIVNKKSMKHKVYVLLNEYGVVEYVGYSKNPKQRFNVHKTKAHPKSGTGKFNGRTDITIEIVKEFDTKKEAELYEGELKLQLGFEWTEKTRAKKCGEATNIPIFAYDKVTGNYVGSYSSQHECARSLGLWVQHINGCLKGRIKSTGGYIFSNKPYRQYLNKTNSNIEV